MKLNSDQVGSGKGMSGAIAEFVECNGSNDVLTGGLSGQCLQWAHFVSLKHRQVNGNAGLANHWTGLVPRPVYLLTNLGGP
jgi:hypothetical protein